MEAARLPLAVCRSRLVGLAFLLASILWPVTAGALTIDVTEHDLGPFGSSAAIYLSGEIKTGDAARLASALATLEFPTGSAAHVVFDSPGGSLVEGMRIGRVIAELPTTVTTDVGDDNSGAGICASACVLAYLGGHYRYLRTGSTLGVHQFYPADGDAFTGAEGVALGQVLSAEIVDYLAEMRVDPAFFREMTRVHPNEIAWVPVEDLERFRVVTGPVFDQSAEYKNADGIYYLLLWQQSYYGENKIMLSCNEAGRVVFVAFLQPPDLRAVEFFPHEFSVTINGQEQAPATSEFAGTDDTWAITVFELSLDQLEQLTSAQTFGAQMVPPSRYVFFGFDFEIYDSKIRDTINGCYSQAISSDAPPTNATAQTGSSGMTVIPGRDFLGGDMDAKGIRGISFEDCQSICLEDARCVAVTWVESSQWCWPKSDLGEYRPAPGLMSALKN